MPNQPTRKYESESTVKSLSHVRLFTTPWTVAYQAPLSMGFSRQEYWSGCHCLLQRIFLTQGSHMVSRIADRHFTSEPPGKHNDHDSGGAGGAGGGGCH